LISSKTCKHEWGFDENNKTNQNENSQEWTNSKIRDLQTINAQKNKISVKISRETCRKDVGKNHAAS